MHINKLFPLWVLIFSAAFILDTKESEEEVLDTKEAEEKVLETKEAEEEVLETPKEDKTPETSAQAFRKYFSNGKPYSGFFCGRLCGVFSDGMEIGVNLPIIFKNGEKKEIKEKKEEEFLILSKRSIESQQKSGESKAKDNQINFDNQINSISQNYPRNRGFSQNGPYPRNRHLPSVQSLHNKRFNQGGKSSRIPVQNTSDKKSELPKGGTFPEFRRGQTTYRSDFHTSFVPSANIIPHDMLILSEHNLSGEVKEGILVEGDIILPRNNDEAHLHHPLLWENGQIHYEMDNSVDFDLRNLIWQAMNEWENSSCIRFVIGCLRPQHCVRITTNTNLCSSLVGVAPGGQDLKLARNCHTLKIVRHELGHVLGFYHEQSRIDRDKYIHINKENLMPNTDIEFNKYMDSWGTEYDYSSVMQYDAKSFSNDRVNKNTMVTPNPHYQTLMGNSKGLSFRDKYRVNKMYSCSARCPNNYVKCLNGGYLSAYKGDDLPCQCICPPRIEGPHCENKPHNYEYYDVPKCSMNVTVSTIIETPGYPNRGSPPEKCSYWIQAPKGKKVLVSFQDFSFADRGDGLEGPNKCYYEKVEIRNQNIFSGDMYCAEDLKGRTFTSLAEDFIMIIDTEDNTRSVRGLKAIVTFV